MGINGILNVNKPSGKTSFSIVAMIRRLTGEKRVGHAGTLDPSATGVLPVCLGQATRVVEYLHELSKEYIAEIELGTTTETFDGEGRITSKKGAESITSHEVRRALSSFLGTIEQVPPAYSAIKVKGRQSYNLARRGIPVSHRPRKVTIDNIEVLRFDNPFLKIKVTCSKGTYIRSLASDLGESLGCGACLVGLVRTAYGPFHLPEAASIDQIRDAAEAGNLEQLLLPLDYPLRHMQSHIVTDDVCLEVALGRDVSLVNHDLSTNNLLRLNSTGGKLIAIMKFVPEIQSWHPEKVFNI